MWPFDIFKEKLTAPKKPYVAFHVAKTDSGNFKDFQRRLLTGSNIILVAGKRGSGKTAMGMKFLEFFKKTSRRKVYAVGFEDTKLPYGIKKSNDMDGISNNSVVLIDESAITYGSRDAMKSSNKQLGRIMSIARHKNLSLILIAQNSAMVDLNILRLADTIILKEPSLLQTKFERKAIKEIYEKANKDFKEVENKKAHFYIMDDEFEGLIKFSLPEFWSDDISTSFRNY